MSSVARLCRDSLLATTTRRTSFVKELPHFLATVRGRLLHSNSRSCFLHLLPAVFIAAISYVVGHDPVTSIFRGQSEDFVKSADPLRIRPVPGSPFHFSALFCGIGDARHLYGSFIDIGQALQSPLGGDSSVHFTLVSTTQKPGDINSIFP